MTHILVKNKSSHALIYLRGPGSPVYSAPEVCTNVTALVQSSKIDVYSFGIMVCEVMISRFPSNERLPGMLLQLQERWSDVGHIVTSLWIALQWAKCFTRLTL